MNKKIHSGNFNIKTPQNYSISTFLKDYIAELKWYTLKVTTDKNPYVANDLVTKYRKQQFLDTQMKKKNRRMAKENKHLFGKKIFFSSLGIFFFFFKLYNIVLVYPKQFIDSMQSLSSYQRYSSQS